GIGGEVRLPVPASRYRWGIRPGDGAEGRGRPGADSPGGGRYAYRGRPVFHPESMAAALREQLPRATLGRRDDLLPRRVRGEIRRWPRRLVRFALRLRDANAALSLRAAVQAGRVREPGREHRHRAHPGARAGSGRALLVNRTVVGRGVRGMKVRVVRDRPPALAVKLCGIELKNP